MEKIIKYEDLYQPIHDEINKYYDNKKIANNKLQMKDAIDQWFSEKFEDWMDDHATKSDRRYKNERRNKNLSVAENRRREARRKAQRRKNLRFNIELPVKLAETIQEAASDASTIEDYMGTSENISGGGLYFKSKVPLKVSSVIQVTLDFSNIGKGFKNIIANAMVVRNNKLPDGEYGISMMFSKVNDQDKANLNYQIFKSLAFQKSDLYSFFAY
ncbi:MAG: PilZ domain-containing protein [Syntrophales bacterium LBB04]|nr:PilZ domain-containing protein [Syntrophales bacterium LBB04]